jgi:molybdopterin molybdotransferase
MYLRYWLDACLGIDQPALYAELKKDVHFTPDLVYFLEARLESRKDGKLIADPVKGNGSGDFANLVRTDGFLVLPQNKSAFRKGEVYPFVSYRTNF